MIYYSKVIDVPTSQTDNKLETGALVPPNAFFFLEVNGIVERGFLANKDGKFVVKKDLEVGDFVEIYKVLREKDIEIYDGDLTAGNEGFRQRLAHLKTLIAHSPFKRNFIYEQD